MIEPSPKNRTPVLVDGCRVPFRRSGTDYTDLIAYDLARSVLKGLLTRSELEPYYPLVRVSEILKSPIQTRSSVGTKISTMILPA